MKLLNNGLMIVSLALLSACSSTPPVEPVVKTVVQTKFEFVHIPDEYIQPCAVGLSEVGDNTSLAQYAGKLEATIDVCNEQLLKAREWNNANRSK
ncbi:Rz1-like lysis system protein LysC [Pseudoalteromonas sp. T1lg22]|uniref:Rz1-like lysis system protein LysC n=1 Tax=Pseudoalteromonas sp. T1lg22 TaxID=2077096 RepID=UPI003FA38900